jgi:Outer membrane protein beta-barrel domain
MKKVSTLVGLTLLALSSSALAQEGAPPPAAEPTMGEPAAAPAAPAAPEAMAAKPAASDSKIQVGLNILPMALGKMEASAGGMSASADAAFAYGVGLSANYVVIPGLTVGIAPQAIFNVKAKDGGGDAAKEYDLMLRLAYAYPVANKISLYGEVLPGYSIVSPSSGDSAKGLVLAFGVGGTMDVTDQLFLNLGVGYQMGFQKLSVGGTDVDFKTKFLRIALGVGMKF